MKRIETSKGRFVVCNKTDNSFLGLICKHESIKLSEITELEASEIIGLEISKTVKYNKKQLHELLESQGIEITNNTYIFKV